jgi:hypothetical protein
MTIPPESFDEQPDSNPEFPQSEEPLDDYSPIADEPAQVSPAPPVARPVDELTVAELIGEFFRAPGVTLDAFLRPSHPPARGYPVGIAIYGADYRHLREWDTGRRPDRRRWS